MRPNVALDRDRVQWHDGGMHKLAVVVVLAAGGLAYAEETGPSVAFGKPTLVQGSPDPAALAVVMKRPPAVASSGGH